MSAARHVPRWRPFVRCAARAHCALDGVGSGALGGQALRAGEDPSPGVVPRCERRVAAVDSGQTLSHHVAPRTLDLEFRFADAVKELEREKRALLLRKRLRLLE